MQKINNRIIQLIKLLNKYKEIVPGNDLCRELGITTRTLRTDLKQYKAYLKENGIVIEAKHRLGYQLHIIDEQKYYQFIQYQMKESYKNQLVIPIYPEDRIEYLIKKLLITDDYIKVDDICEEIFVSRSTLNNDLKQARDKLSYFRLDIETKPAHGIKISGSEFYKRSCISQFFYHIEDSDNNFLLRTKTSSTYQESISRILYQTMEEESFKLTDIGFRNLVIHIMIAINRLKENITSDKTGFEQQIYNTKELSMAKILCKKLEKEYAVTFPEVEQYYIALHLSGKKAMQYNSNNLLLHTETDQLLQFVFKRIKSRFNIDMSEDIELYTSLSLHFQPMMNRLKYGLHIQNPLLKQIKQEHAESFEMGIIVADTIKKEKKYDVSENEIGYIALHFALAIERYQNNTIKKNIIIICASGVGSSQILLHKVRQKFKDSIEKIYVTELYALDKVNQEDYDFILTTIPLITDTKIPVIYVQYFLDQSDTYQIQEALLDADQRYMFIDQYFSNQLFFTQLNGKTKEEIIHEMCLKINKIKPLPQNFEEQVLLREQYSTTEFGNAIAMPHPMQPMTSETFVSVGFLPRAIKWQNQNVKFIFLLCIEKNGKESLSLFHETLSALVMDNHSLSLLEKEPTIENIKKILKNLAKQEQDIDDLFS